MTELYVEPCDCGAQEAAVLSHLGVSPDSLHPWDDFNFVPITCTCEIAAHSLWPLRKGAVALLVPVTATKDICSKTPF